MVNNKHMRRRYCEELNCGEKVFLNHSMTREKRMIRQISAYAFFGELITEVVSRLDLDPLLAEELIEQLLP